jgi:hypothetical protein
MTNNIKFLCSAPEISQHGNWGIIEQQMINNLKSTEKIFLCCFCEMHFRTWEGYILKPIHVIKDNWIGIIHNPEDTEKYWPRVDLLKNPTFMKSLPYCKGLFCMSNETKNWIIKTINPSFFVAVLYHPLSTKKLKEFDFKKYNKNKCIIQIGNWLRRSYSIYQIKCTIKKKIIPFDDNFRNELNHFLKKDKIVLTSEEKESVIELQKLSDIEYNNLFCNHIVFLNLYSSTCNNVILECIKANNPIIINRLSSVERYLGKEYPLFYNNLSEVSDILNNDELILKGHLYLKDMNKEKFNINNMLKDINKHLTH